MWKWRIVFKMMSTGEEIKVEGDYYPDEEIAQWAMSLWLKKSLPSFYLYRVIKKEVYCERCDTGDN